VSSMTSFCSFMHSCLSLVGGDFKAWSLTRRPILCWCWGPSLCLQNGKISPNQNLLVMSLIFILNFQKNWIRFMMISTIELKSFQINLVLELFMCLRLELL
jgi:hypothetical protein